MNDLAPLMKNPTIPVLDHRDNDEARNYQAHEQRARELAQTRPTSSMFTLVQRSSRGFWISEWSVVRSNEGRDIIRRRIARGPTMEQTVQRLMKRSSTSKSRKTVLIDGVIPTLRHFLA